MELITIQKNVLINPEKIIAIQKTVEDGQISIRVFVEGHTFEVTSPEADFLAALNRAGVDLTKQFFAV